MRFLPFLVTVLSCLVAGCARPADTAAPAGPTALPPDAPYAGVSTLWTVDRGMDLPFGFVSAAALGIDGSLYVADGEARVIHRFDRFGEPVVAMGRPGRGPGEFEAITSISVSADTLFVWDPVVWRITAFDPEGTLILTRRVIARTESGLPSGVGRSADGTWLYLDQEIPGLSDPDVELEAGLVRATARLVRWSTEQDSWIPVAEFPGTRASIIRDGNGEPSLSSAPLPVGPLWVADGAGGYWHADSETYRVTHRGVAGEMLAEIAIGMEGPPATETDREEFVSAAGRLDPSSEESRRRAAMDMPGRRPVLRELLTSRSGELWVSVDSGEPGSEWHVFGPDNRMRYRLKLPPMSDLLYVEGDTLVVVTRGALDVQSVSRMVVQR